MSIFGIKSQQQNDDFKKSISTLTMHVRDLHCRVKPVTDLDERISDLQDKLKEVTIDNRLIHNDIDLLNDKMVFTIFAESKGTILKDEIFSFGNGCRDPNVGYCIMRRCQILGIALSSERQSGPVGVGISVDGKMLPGCEIVLNTTPRKHDNFDTPFIVEAGSFINFISTIENTTTTCSVASLLMKLI